MGVSVVLVILFYVKSSGIPSKTEFAEQITLFGASLEYYMVWTYILIITATAGAVVFPILNIITNPKGAVKTLVGVALFAVVIFVAFALADNTVMEIPAYTGEDNVPDTLKWSGAVLYTMYILLIGAIVSIFYVEVAKIFK